MDEAALPAGAGSLEALLLDENAPTSTWLPSSHTMPPPPRPGRGALIAVTVIGAVSLAFVAVLWMSGGGESGAATSGRPTATATTTGDGTIDETELLSLRALCEELGDGDCPQQAAAALEKKPASKRSTVSQGVSDVRVPDGPLKRSQTAD